MDFSGKKGIVLGVLNKRSIAADCANQLLGQGASLICSFLPDADTEKGKKFQHACKAVPELAEENMLPYDAANPESVSEFFCTVKERFGRVDFLVHAIASVPGTDSEFPISSVGREVFSKAMAVTVFSLIDATRGVKGLMTEGGSIITYSYLSSASLVPGYELLGVCKAALESSVLHLSRELASVHIRINTVSAPPVPSSAALTHPRYRELSASYEKFSPMKRIPSLSEINKAALFLLSDDASAMTGERIFVDGGFHHASGV